MKLLSSILVLMLFCISVFGQNTNVNKKSSDKSKTTIVEKTNTGRYEILVTSFLVIKLDTFTGQIQYYSPFAASKNSLKWISSDVGGLPDESSNLKSKYRIFSQESEEVNRYYFYLVNTETGQTWISRTVFKSSLTWEPFLGN